MPLTLTWLSRTTLPVEGESLSPSKLAGQGAQAVARMRISCGNAQVEVGELFGLAGEVDGAIRFEGDLTHVRGIARGLDGGSVKVYGNVGAHLGAEMSGGQVLVRGSVGDYAGAEMRGGLLRVFGNTGRALGAAYPGSRLGMRDGVILVEGDVAEEAGRRMRRGLIAVRGRSGDGFGRNLIAGTLIALGPVGRAAGFGMKRGTLVLAGEGEADLLPSFEPSGRYRFPFLGVYARQLSDWGFDLGPSVPSDLYERYNGDLAEGGHGEILVGANRPTGTH